jgi:DNA-binding MarR family transcriptional regulator
MNEKLSFEDILDQLMLEEPRPTHEALVRWSERYPEYRDALAQYFATWAIQGTRAEVPEQTVIEEERIAQKGVAHAMEILRKQGRVVSRDSVPSLSAFDQVVLAAIYLLQGRGEPATITLKASEISGKQALLGSVFVSLNQLESQGLAVSRYPDPEDKTRRCFTVTMVGERALAHAREASTVVARFLPDFV